MRRAIGGGAMTPAEVRGWRECLNLTESEAAEALNLGNEHTVFRELQSGKRVPGGPTRLLMEIEACMVVAVIFLRTGRAQAAKAMLEQFLTPPLIALIERHPEGFFDERATNILESIGIMPDLGPNPIK